VGGVTRGNVQIVSVNFSCEWIAYGQTRIIRKVEEIKTARGVVEKPKMLL
jgi:hypothetical protein